jgi:FkbM family methyltransferase
MGFHLHFLRASDLFVDNGANVGSYTILDAGVVKAKTFSIEPSHDTFKKLLRNIDHNSLIDIVTAVNIGLGSE